MIPLIYIILGILLARLVWRQLVTAAAILLCVLLIASFYRLSPLIGIDRNTVIRLLAYAIGAFGGALVAWRVLVTFIVNSDRRRAHEQVDMQHDKRLP